MTISPLVQIELNAYSVRKPQAELDQLEPIRSLKGLVDFENFTIQLQNGEQARFNFEFNALNTYVLNTNKPINFKPIWLHRVDNHVWFEVDRKLNPSLPRYVRKDGHAYISLKGSKEFTKNQIFLLEPVRKLLHCKRTVKRSDGTFFQSTQLVYETPKFLIYQNYDGTKEKYTKKLVHDDPIGFIDLDEDNVEYLYLSKVAHG